MNNDQLCLSICKRLKNTCRMYIDDTKSIYRRYKEYLQPMQKVLQTIQKSICRRYKKYLQTIQKVFADDTGNLPEETTIRDREFAYTTACLVEGQFFGLWNVLLLSFCIFLQPWQKCLYFSLPPPSSVPGGQAVIIVCSVIVREKNQPHTSASAFTFLPRSRFYFIFMLVQFSSIHLEQRVFQPISRIAEKKIYCLVNHPLQQDNTFIRSSVSQ